MSTCKCRTKVLFCSAMIVLSFASCMNESYDLNKVETEVTIGGENLTIPLGKTERLTITDMLASTDQELLTLLENGTYAVGMKDSIDLTDQIPDIAASLKIDDQLFNQQVEYTIEDLSENQILFKGETIHNPIEFAEGDILKDLTIPEISEHQEMAAGIWEYVAKTKEMNLGLDPFGFKLSEVLKFNAPGLALLPDDKSLTFGEINIHDIPLQKKVANVNIKASRPQGINQISQIRFGEKSRIKVSMSMAASFVKNGQIVPDITLDLSQILKMKQGSAIINLGQDFAFKAGDASAIQKEYFLDEVLILPSDWTAEGQLDLNKSVTVSGKINLGSASTTGAEVKKGSANLGIDIQVEFLDMNIASAEIGLDPIVIDNAVEMPIDIKDIELYKGVKNVKSVSFSDNSQLNIQTSFSLSQLPGLKMNLKKLEIAFPTAFQVAGANKGVISYANEDLKAGLQKEIQIQKINFPSYKEGFLAFNDKVSLQAQFEVSGTVNTADLPDTPERDAKFTYQVGSHFEIVDGEIECDDIRQEIPVVEKDIKVELGPEFGDFGTFTVYPEGVSTDIVFDLAFPTSELDLQADNIKIDLPDFIILDEQKLTLPYNKADNSITINGSLPPQIVIPIQYFVVKPVKDPVTGQMIVEDKIHVAGNAMVKAGSVFVKQLNNVLNSQSSIDLTIPEIKIKTIRMDEFKMDFDQNFDFTILKGKDLPAELVNVSKAELDNVQACFNLKVNNLPDFGKGVEPMLDMTIGLPKELILAADPRVDGQQLHITGKLVEGKLDIAPIYVTGIDFSAYDFVKKPDLVANVSLNGGIKVVNPTVDFNQISGRTVSANTDITIKNIKFKTVIGQVDYRLDPVCQEIVLDQLPEFVRDEKFVLDFKNPYLQLKVKTNVGIAMTGNMNIVPYFNGQPDQEKSIVLKQVNFPASANADQDVEGLIFIGGDKTYCPEGYDFYQADLAKLLKRIPEKLEINFDANTVAEKECIIEPDKKYNLAIQYDMTVPLEFGEELNLEVCDTIADLPEMVQTVLESGTLKLKGEIVSALPLQMDMNIGLLDLDDHIIPLEKEASQLIKPCGTDGKESVSPLDLTLSVKKGTDLSRLNAFKVSFRVNSGNVSGVPVTDQSFIQAVLKLGVPGGITVDLKQNKDASKQ